MTRAFHRRPRGGRIDRLRPIAFTFDGKTHSGFAGDTLASALLASDVVLVGRSFKYHRPRGIVAAGIEEPNGLVTLGQGGRREPNVPATTIELADGLLARSQNSWPSRGFDLMAVNQFAAPLLPAGFYYKTFMGPRRNSWMVYEPWIRRAAGLGKPTAEPDPDRYEARHEHVDVLIVGGGPAGLAAAIAAGRAGARVLLTEQSDALGGALLAEPVGGPEAAWLGERIVELAALDRVAVLTRATAFGLYDHDTVGLIERRDHRAHDPARGQARQVVVTVRAKAIVLATGAIERPLLFPNNDRPGVMLAAALRTYVNRYALRPGSHAVVATNNDSAWRTAFDLAADGLAVTIADVRREPDAALARLARSKGIDVRLGTAVVDIAGRARVTGAAIAELADGGNAPDAGLEIIAADVVALSGGWSPAVHLSSHLGIKPRWREDVAAFVPGGFAPTHFGCGAMLGTETLAAIVEESFATGRRAAAVAGHGRRAGEAPSAPAVETLPATPILPLWQIPTPRSGKAFVDQQNDVTVADVALAYREGYRSVEHLKRYTTLGMGTDQGKTSNVTALALMAGLTGKGFDEVGTTTFRPPYSPVALGALAGRAIGAHFRPVRRSPLHDWHLANGATMIEAGPWLRAWWYAWAGATVEAAYVKEMALVRSGVGVADVSSLGKIDVAGPDAAEFLDRVYVNGFATLAVGKARYGVMLGDDGIVIDDGTTTRLAEHRFFLTTTTAQAGEVMSWLEFLLETAWTDLRVTLCSSTDQWGAIALSGPKARDVLARAFPGVDASNAALPYMGALETCLDGVQIRILRLSFSGELAYEVYCPADFSAALIEHVLAAGAGYGIKPYGLEALASLRIEKGHVAGNDLDHRNTLQDLGLGKMASRTKDFVGKALLERPAHRSDDRWSLVGLECLEDGKRLRGGAILFAAGDELKGHGRGHVMSTTWSTVRGRWIALGLYQGGLRHDGAEIVCAFPLKDETVRARIVSPRFYDPDGSRLHV